MLTQNAKRLLKALWIKACRLDNIPINSKFAVFSEDNKFANRHNKIMALVMTGTSKNFQDRSIFSVPLA